MQSFGDCIICGDLITTRILLPCNHSSFCIKCYYTLLNCYNESKCPFCQKEVTSDPICSSKQDLEQYNVEILKHYQHDINHHVYFDNNSIIRQIASFKRITCPDCKSISMNFGSLENHVKKEHNKNVCRICFDSQRFLPSEISSYTNEEFNIHKKLHPECTCCKTIAFDQDSLSKHMRENHFRCEICAKAGKILWFENIDLIQVHFHEYHYACENPLCVMQGFIVFATKAELLLHKVNVHDADPSILVEDIDNKPKMEIEVDEGPNRHERHRESKKRLFSNLKKEFNGNVRKCLDFQDLIYRVDNEMIPVEIFCQRIREFATQIVCDKLFPDIVASITHPDIRKEVVKKYQGVESTNLSKIDDEFPSFETAAKPEAPKPAPHKPQKSKKKAKKIVLNY